MTDVTLVTGDGIGPEIAEATRRCIDATGADINWDIVEAGVDVMEREGTPLPDATVESIRKTGIAPKAPITTWDRPTCPTAASSLPRPAWVSATSTTAIPAHPCT